MVDIVDLASKLESENLQHALNIAKNKSYDKMVRSTKCLYCNSELESGKINFCDADCKADYDYEQLIKRNQGLIK